jgi:anti-sigma regulatory factor (Ser/Thr protein kinase)
MEMSGTFRRDIGALPDVFRLVENFLSQETARPELQFALDFAIEEIFTNMVKYNSAGQSDLRVTLGVREGSVFVHLTDFDTGRFDINTEAPETDVSLPLERRTPGGLGVQLVKKMMDRVEYIHQNRTGTITLYKRLE